ncbi:hypothetical protein TanjilG_25026 [Lupinus angustifolius]|uniref:Uncharacterized protein n=1 Tax=Lupinus angustifolius TaxID=3871 RepID=A0A1J7H8U1_LUPAN|nr:hypothetical protein TanjilG_25026 [Lupinus angustifolius]
MQAMPLECDSSTSTTPLAEAHDILARHVCPLDVLARATGPVLVVPMIEPTWLMLAPMIVTSCLMLVLVTLLECLVLVLVTLSKWNLLVLVSLANGVVLVPLSHASGDVHIPLPHASGIYCVLHLKSLLEPSKLPLCHLPCANGPIIAPIDLVLGKFINIAMYKAKPPNQHGWWALGAPQGALGTPT